MARAQRRREPAGPFEATVDDLDHSGRGVAHRDGKAVFIPDCLPGERIRYRVTGGRRHYDEGRLDALLEAAGQRVEPRCPHFGSCGGCSLQHLGAAAQVDFKQARVLETLARIGHVRPANVLPPLTGPVWGYRRRARLGARYVAAKGGVLVGFRERGSSRIAVLDGCDILIPEVGRRIDPLKALLTSLSIRERVPQIEVAGGDDAVALVLRVLAPPTAGDLERLRDFAQREGLWLFLQPGGPDSLYPLLPETPPLAYRLPAYDMEIRFEPTDFIQVNGAINRALVARALEVLAPGPDETVLELFAGLGNFSLPLARHAGSVVTVEGDAALVERARANAGRNGIRNVETHTADLFQDQSDAVWLRGAFDKLLLDPPRSGAREILPAVTASRPGRIVYVSCDPGTLARDAGLLVHEQGYRLTAAGVIDMFPHTAHVESMAVFEAA